MLQAYSIAAGAIQPRAPEATVSKTGATEIFLYVAPTEVEMRELVEVHEISAHDLASALDPDELGRLEILGARSAFVLKVPRNFTSETQLLFTVTSMGLFLFPKKLVVVTTDEVDLFHDKMIHRVASSRDALLKILYGTISHFLDHLKVINMLSESLENRVHVSMGNRYLLDMFTLEKSLVYFVNGIASNEMVLEKMRVSAARLKLGKGQADTLDDIIIENQQCSKQAEIYSNILTGLMDARGSVVNNNLSLIMKRLTIISVIFMPMNVIAGMGGMSEYSAMIEGALPWYIAYPVFLIGLCVVGLFTYWVLRKAGFERDEQAAIKSKRKSIPRVPRSTRNSGPSTRA